MSLNKYHHLKNKEIYILIFLIIFSILIRIPAVLIFGDTSLENEWKDIVNNLIESGELLYRGAPNLFMPPLYAFYLYFFSIFKLEGQNYILLILLSQVLLSSISVAVLYKLNKLFFSHKISFYSSLLFSLFPLYIYASTKISSINLQVFLTIIFFFYFFEFKKRKNFLTICLFSLTGGLFILLRGEFIIIFILSILYLLIYYKVELKKIFLILIVSLFVISPYLVRNILIFDTITITKSLGYNLWKGNNPNSTVEGSVVHSKNLLDKIKNLSNDKYHPSNLDKIYLDEAIGNIQEEPKRYLILFIKKFFSILFVDIKSSYPNYYNPIHYLPLLLVGITSLIGIIFSDKKSYELNYLFLIFFITVIIYSSFFILPRYQLAILPLQIIFTNILVEHIYRRYFRRNE